MGQTSEEIKKIGVRMRVAGIRQYQLAAAANIPPNTMSCILTGRVNATAEEMQRIEKSLKQLEKYEGGKE